jgi:hypothetical protein
MPKYGQKKYKTFKYGRYYAVKVGKTVKYRMGNVINQSITLDGNLKVRLKSNSSDYVISQSIRLSGNFPKIRLRANDSTWVVANRITLEEIER